MSLRRRAEALLRIHAPNGCSVAADHELAEPFRAMEREGKVVISASGTAGYLNIHPKGHKIRWHRGED